MGTVAGVDDSDGHEGEREQRGRGDPRGSRARGEVESAFEGDLGIGKGRQEEISWKLYSWGTASIEGGIDFVCWEDARGVSIALVGVSVAWRIGSKRAPRKTGFTMG